MLCAHRCGVNRHLSASGICKLGAQARVYREYLHFGEEPWISPSYTVYLSGCNFRCRFCSEWGPVTRPDSHGLPLIPEELAGRIEQSIVDGAQTVSFVGGEPGVNLLPVLETLSQLDQTIEVVWNTNGFGIRESYELLRGLVSHWAIDWKFGNPKCAQTLARVEQAWSEVHESSSLLLSRGESVFFRHLVMPNHLDCCTVPVLKSWVRRGRPGRLNIMSSFIPQRGTEGRWMAPSRAQTDLQTLLEMHAGTGLYHNGYPT